MKAETEEEVFRGEEKVGKRSEGRRCLITEERGGKGASLESSYVRISSRNSTERERMNAFQLHTYCIGEWQKNR